MSKKDYEGAVFLLKSLASQGVWEAYGAIGEFYESGAPGFPRDQSQAINWYRRAVFEADDDGAHLGLGRAYLAGRGVAQDSDEAVRHFRAAEKSRPGEAALYLGYCYMVGCGVPKDWVLARAYFETAAKEKYFYAFVNLAHLARAEGRLWRALGWFVKGLVLGFRLVLSDKGDRRLIGISEY